MTKGARDLKRLVSPEVTQERLAELLDVSQQAVSAWVHGKAKPSPDRMAKLEDLFGIPMRAWTEEPAEEAPPDSTRTGPSEPESEAS